MSADYPLWSMSDPFNNISGGNKQQGNQQQQGQRNTNTNTDAPQQLQEVMRQLQGQVETQSGISSSLSERRPSMPLQEHLQEIMRSLHDRRVIQHLHEQQQQQQHPQAHNPQFQRLLADHQSPSRPGLLLGQEEEEANTGIGTTAREERAFNSNLLSSPSEAFSASSLQERLVTNLAGNANVDTNNGSGGSAVGLAGSARSTQCTTTSTASTANSSFSSLHALEQLDAPSSADITDMPGPNDVLLGRGGETNNHSGNINFRQLVLEYREAYREAPKTEKPAVARRLVAHWRKLEPRGRFLAKAGGPNSNIWRDVGDKNAQKRASKSLGERDKPPKRPYPFAAAASTSDRPDPPAPAPAPAAKRPKTSASRRRSNTAAPGNEAVTSTRVPSYSTDNHNMRSAGEAATRSSHTTGASSSSCPGSIADNHLIDMFQQLQGDAPQEGPLQDSIPTAADLVSSVFSSSNEESSPDVASSGMGQPPSEANSPPEVPSKTADV